MKVTQKINNYFRFLGVLAILLFYVIDMLNAQNHSFSNEDKLNTSEVYNYDQPILPKKIWTITDRHQTTKDDYQNGHILKNISPRPEWKVPFGLFPIWFGSKEYVFNSPLVTGGQITVQWSDVELKKGKYDFSKIENLLQAYYVRKLYTTIQINGNEKPDYLFDEIPYISKVKWSVQVGDEKGTLMYWYPQYVENYTNLIKAFGDYLAKSAYKKSIIGIRFNLNAVGTEHIEVPEMIEVRGVKQYPRKVSSYIYPEKADKTFAINWTKVEVVNYEKAVIGAYINYISPVCNIFLRNNLDDKLIEIAQPEIEKGKIGLFHTSSEPEPRSGAGEKKLLQFNTNSRTPKTASYAEEWADCWGIHIPEEDPHFCSPQQWNYWRVLCDLNVGVSYMGMYGSIWAYAMGDEAPKNSQFDNKNATLRREEIRRSIEFAYKYLGHHNNPAKSPGAYVAFRQSTENLSMAQNPEFYKKFPTPKIEIFTGDYSFLSLRLPDNSTGLKLVGSPDQRFGAFARKINERETMRIAFHPFFSKAIYLKPATLRVVYFDTPKTQWNIQYGEYQFKVTTKGTNNWLTKEFKVVGAERRNAMDKATIIEKGQLATKEELLTLQPDIIITALKGAPIFHMVEIDRSSLFQKNSHSNII